MACLAVTATPPSQPSSTPDPGEKLCPANSSQCIEKARSFDPANPVDYARNINWATLQLEATPEDSAYTYPDFVDTSKISYASIQYPSSRRQSRVPGIGLYAPEVTERDTDAKKGNEGDEPRDSICDIEEILVRGPITIPLASRSASGMGKARERDSLKVASTMSPFGRVGEVEGSVV